jgi:hypothetical protein
MNPFPQTTLLRRNIELRLRLIQAESDLNRLNLELANWRQVALAAIAKIERLEQSQNGHH